MPFKKRLAVSLIAAAMSSSAMAVDLGEFGGTKLKIGGYIKTEAIFNSPDGASNTFDATARQSRINFSATKNVEGSTVTAFVEGDFWGVSSNSQKSWRLRHAFMKVDGLTLGQTWNGQFFATAPFDGELIDFFSAGLGTIAGNGSTVRPDMVMHYQTGGMRLTLQDPINTDADMPDMVAAYTKRLDGGTAFNLAVTARQVANGTDDEIGLGASAAAKVMLGQNSFHVSAFAGEGMGAYSGINTSDLDGTDLASQVGFAAAYRQVFSEKLRGTVRYGQVTVDNAADTEAKLTSVNLIYKVLPAMEVGIEYRDRNMTTMGLRPKGSQVEVMAKYSF